MMVYGANPVLEAIVVGRASRPQIAGPLARQAEEDPVGQDARRIAGGTPAPRRDE